MRWRGDYYSPVSTCALWHLPALAATISQVTAKSDRRIAPATVQQARLRSHTRCNSRTCLAGSVSETGQSQISTPAYFGSATHRQDRHSDDTDDFEILVNGSARGSYWPPPAIQALWMVTSKFQAAGQYSERTGNALRINAAWILGPEVRIAVE